MAGFGQVKAVAIALRISMVISVVMTLLTIAKIVVAAVNNDLAEFSKAVEVEVTQPLHDWQIIAAGALLLVWFAPLFFCFWKLHCLLGQLDSRNYFAVAAERMIRSIGWSLIIFWAIAYCISSFGPAVVTYYDAVGPKFDLSWPFDVGMVFVFIGSVLVLLAKVLAEGRRLDEEAKLIV